MKNFVSFTLKNLPINWLRALPQQPGHRTNLHNMRGLKRTMTKSHICHPLAVVDNGDGTFTVADGHRRWKFALETGETHVPCIVYPVGTDADTLFIDLNKDTRKIGGAEWLVVWALTPAKQRANILKDFPQNQATFIKSLLNIISDKELAELADGRTSPGIVEKVDLIHRHIANDMRLTQTPTKRETLYWLHDNNQQNAVQRFISVEVINKKRRGAMKELVGYILAGDAVIPDYTAESVVKKRQRLAA